MNIVFSKVTHERQEAREKWCPFGMRNGGQGSYNRTADDVKATMCIENGCMAWVDNSPNSGPQNSKGYCGMLQLSR